MRTRLWLGCLLCLLCLAGAWFLWHHGNRSLTQKKNIVPATAAAHPAPAMPVVSGRGLINTNVTQISLADWNTNRFAGRLSNTAKSIGQLVGDRHAILLANALMDTSLPLNFIFPKNLQSQGDPGAYIVQARGPIDNAFRAMLAQAGATVVAYIPNDAYLVRASASVAGLLGANPQTQAVVPYEPYYKIQSPMLSQAVRQMVLPDKTILTLGLFADDAPATRQQIGKLGGQVVGQDQSPFGPVVRVIPPKNWTTLATLSGVQIVEPFHPRALANDLSRATVGVAADSLTATNYLNLTGSNIIVEVNDTGIDALHPDLTAGGFYSRALGVIGDAPQSLVDTNGHGTHVAGIIAGDGAESTTVTNAPGSTLPGGTGTNYQFRGMAPGATLYSVGGIFGGSDTNIISDQYFQEVPALTNALISNNSWVFEGDSAYDLAAASYDAAVRDALPFVSGSQPVLFVFAAGNAGNGGDDSDFGGGIPDSIESPATAKDVITVGAIQENRDITNIVTTINPDGTTNTSQPWQPETSTSYRVAGFSSRGNVGIGIEGTFGRYKPDVVAPGTFVVSTRSEQWDIGTYFYQDPTNNQIQTFSGLVVQPGSIFSSSFPSAPTNTVQLAIDIFPNADSPVPFPNLPIYVGLFTSPTIYDFIGANNPLLIPGDPNAPANYLQQIFSSEGFLGAFNYAVSNNTANPISFDLQTDVITTNGTGDYFLVLSNLDQSIGTLNSASTGPGPYYRYETGTSMSAADVSGTLALMQEFYVNAYGVRPSPAMLKAMLINGARATGFYDYQAQNAINYEGWGLINLPGSLPPGITNQLGQSCSTFIQDQNPTNALATGDSQTWQVTTTNALPMHVTLAWTDPPGDPAAAIKLVNNLVLVVTNLSNPTNPIVYYGNDIPASSTVNSPHATNTPPNFDSINNVQNVNLPLGAGTNFSVTVMGYRVNVNAVTAQANNVVQDYALVVSCGNGQDTNAMTVTTPAPAVSNPTGDQQVTYLAPSAAGAGTSFQQLLNQFAGASSPLLGTNTIVFPPGTNGFGPNNWQVTVGMTNQWQFYVVTNANSYSNAAFITFNPNAPEPDTLAVPTMGVFGGTTENASRDADIDMYVTTDPTITNLNPVAISNAVVLGQIGGPPGTVLPGLGFAGASLGRGTTEVVVDTNAWSRTPNVYYIGVKSEDQMSAEYGFITIFSQTPFSQMNPNGSQTVNGQPVPMNIPDGSPALPGKGYVFGIAIFPMTVASVTVSDSIWHQNFGDLIGTLTLNGAHPDVLNNHDSFGNPPGPYYLTYDDGAGGGIIGSRPSDGPGSLNTYIGLQGLGVWMLTEVDDSLTQTGAVYNCNLLIQPHQKPTLGVITNFVPGGSWVYDFIDVPPGATNLTIYATNLTDTANPPVELFVKFGSEPTTNNYDAVVQLTPSGVISLGPPLVSGRYFFGLFNPSPSSAVQKVTLFATIGLPFVPAQTIYNSTDTPVPILDDAVTTDNINVPDNQIISSLDVALAVQHPRISDLVFHLISPDGTRVLLMENRGGTDPNGAGGVATVTTNTALASDFDTAAPGDYGAGQPVGGWIVNGNQVSVQTDPANAYPGKTNLLALANGTLATTLATVPGATYTLTFAYRGPDIVSMWRGESNAFDSADGNDGTWNGTQAYGPGEVNSAFSFNGASDIGIPNAPSLNPPGSFSIEGWIYPLVDKYNAILSKWEDGGERSYALETIPGLGLEFPISDLANQNNNAFQMFNVTNVLTLNRWSHVAATYDSAAGIRRLYVNGVLVGIHTNAPVAAYNSTPPVTIGAWLRPFTTQDYFDGSIDELGFYGRSLSASEVQAISAEGTTGDFNPNKSIPGALAEAQVSINGGAPATLFGNNTSWQSYTVTFTATQSSTPLQIQGIEPGVLLDAASVASVQTNYSYLVFTENTNLTTTPIKFAVPPFLPTTGLSNIAASGFDSATPGDYTTAFSDGANVWNVLGNQVSVVNDPANADAGNHFLALANGTVSSTLPTVAGQTYTLTFRYRGPAIDGWWRAESNTVDSIYGNNGTWVNGAVYAVGEVGTTFDMNGVNNYVLVNPASPHWNFGQTTGFTIEGWINPASTSPNSAIIEFERALGTTSPNDVGVDFSINSTGPGALDGNIKDSLGGNHSFYSANGIIIPNVWQHVALSYNKASGVAVVYYNGTAVLQTNLGIFTPETSFTNLLIGGRTTFINPNLVFPGGIDELSMYDRPLSDSEIQAISQNGPAGKFDPTEFAVSPPQSLAEAQVSVNGGAPTNLFGNNVNWQTESITFKATQNGTPLQITGVEPGMLLDSFSLSQSANKNYYLPEQSLDTYDGLDALGNWTLEIQDDRVGATNPMPELLSWQLRFNYVTFGTNANGIPPGTTETNVIPAGDWHYFPVNVPTNADWATNILVFATGPLDMWFNPTNDPVGTSPPDYELLAASTGGSAALSLTSSPTNIIPGETYFIGLHNTNTFPVTNGFRVDFDLIFPPTPLTNGVPITNTIPASLSITSHGFGTYSVTVPTNADYATNVLIFATLPVNMWFCQSNVFTFTNPPDYLLLTNATNGVSILSAGTTPPLVPGSTYYLAIQNTNGVPVTIGLEVDFHFVPAVSIPITGPTLTATNINGTNGFLLQWSGPTNDQYTIQWKTNLAPVFLWNTVSNPVINVTYTPTNGDYSWFDDGSLTGGWPPEKFYRVLANFISEPITNSTPVTNIVVSGTITPLTVAVPTNAMAAINVLFSATGPLNVYFNQTGPPTGNTNAGDILMLTNATSGTFVLAGSSVPPLVPGANYYLGLQNPGAGNVSFVFQVSFGYASPPTNPPAITSITLTNVGGSNAVLLQWVAPTNYQFQVEWATNLAPAIAWQTVSNVVVTWSGVVSPTNAAEGLFQFLDDGSRTGGWGPLKFYRLVEYPYSTPIPQTLTIINTAIVGNAVRFQWLAPTNYQYQVLWTTNLGLPLASWSVLANPVLGLSNGVYTFTDTNQTGPATSPKFFRLLEH